MTNILPMAQGVTKTDIPVPDDMLAGEMPLITGQGEIGNAAVAARTVLMVGSSGNAGKLVAYDGTPGAAVAIAAADLKASARGPIYEGGYFNHEWLIWPAGSTMDTYLERKTAFASGSTIKVGKVL